jgi:hypothetical protein
MHPIRDQERGRQKPAEEKKKKKAYSKISKAIVTEGATREYIV